jgi:hypothetical protein
MADHQNARQDHNLNTANIAIANLAKFKYLDMTVTYQNDIHKEVNL